MTGSELIAAERRRQIEKEGWTAEHDQEHVAMSLAKAGACYALDVAEPGVRKPLRQCMFDFWPWSEEWWKPTPDDPVRQLVKAGALIAAEIDRIQNAGVHTPSEAR